MAAKVKSSAFDIHEVKKKMPIKKFLESKKVIFAKGKAFYEMTKGEIVQDYKKVVVMRNKDNMFITGEGVRDVLKIPKTTTVSKVVLDSDEIPDFSVFVQSTSYNRAVLPGTRVLFQVEDDIDDKMDVEDDDEEDPDDEEELAKPTARRSARRGRAAAAAAAKKTPAVAAATKNGKAKKAAAPKKAAAGRPKRAAAKRKLGTPSDDSSSSDEEVCATVSAKVAKTAGAAPSSPAATPAPPVGGAPPGGPVEIAFSFDTTGSMYACLGEVRRTLKETITRLQKDIPGIRIAVIAHGDYCDQGSSYVTKQVDFTTDLTKLCNFVQNVGSTGGGDFDECYELVLREAHTKLSWTDGTTRSLVVIGDATPHAPSYSMNKQNICWKKECDTLKDKEIKIYAVQALNRGCSTKFYGELASRTGGYHLKLDQFSSIINFMMAICFKEQGPDQFQSFEDELKSTGMNRELHRMFDNLSGRAPTTFAPTTGAGPAVGTAGLEPVNASRFQVLHVPNKCSIKEFVQKNSLIFKAGRGFYEFTKSEVISHKKEVVLVDKATGDLYTGPAAARAIGAGGAGKISPASLDKYRVFVQSTSYNRQLVGGTGFLYEVDTDH